MKSFDFTPMLVWNMDTHNRIPVGIKVQEIVHGAVIMYRNYDYRRLAPPIRVQCLLSSDKL